MNNTFRRGKLATSNCELLAKVVMVDKLLGMEVVKPAEARKILGINK